jgi:hypothetical protein
VAHRAAEDAHRHTEAVAHLDHVIDIGLAQLLDHPARLESVDLEHILFRHPDPREQRGVGFC